MENRKIHFASYLSSLSLDLHFMFITIKKMKTTINFGNNSIKNNNYNFDNIKKAYNLIDRETLCLKEF